MCDQAKTARWDDLQSEGKDVLKGHVGPGWLPQWICNKLAFYFIKLFQIDAQQRHDFGYIVGGDAAYRHECDQTLLSMMREDSNKLNGKNKRLALFVSDLFYIAVRMFGWLSFKWRDQSLTLDHFHYVLDEKRRQLEDGTENKIKWLAVLPTLIIIGIVAIVSTLALVLVPLYTEFRRRKNRGSDAPPTIESEGELSQ